MEANDKKPTKVEILKKHCKNTRGHWIGLTKEGVLKAMQEYAELYHKEKLRGELKAFNNFVLKLEEEGKIPLIDRCIDEYLKTKE